MNEKLSHLIWVVILGSLYSCSSYKKVPYFQDLNTEEKTISGAAYVQPVINKNDILEIKVTAANQEALNTHSLSAEKGAESRFIVDHSGQVKVPLIGLVKVEGMTTNEAENVLEKSFSKVVKEPLVNVRLADFKISVLGDVEKPGVYSIPSERVSILEALGLAGDLRLTAERDNVLLIREKNGEKTFSKIDLTSKKVFNSPDFYLQKNDVIYVKPGKAAYAAYEKAPKVTSLVISVAAIFVSLGLLLTR
ncbi:polysaccharide biosynthesis/export family protein [Desertivirga arenae]|uniref:polysaccharide biosynthesis/export family protein n=1 Tax=Desertivirga arenae TaxID=2810309 RepID=UPI001A9792AE|nr:polysaccharide biosynthesis/export family protein [Pedobacter sp. SYSU D00823]